MNHEKQIGKSLIKAGENTTSSNQSNKESPAPHQLE